MVLGHPQVHSTSKKLLYQLDHLVQICNQPGMEQTTRKHVGISISLSLSVLLYEDQCIYNLELL